jgi:zinc protease
MIWTAAIGVAFAAELAPLDVETYTLPNGLNVILSEDHSVPFVWTNLWYDVGSKDESPGRSGFAHLFEHLMFQGSEHSNDDYFIPLQKVGAVINGTTNLDRTNYFEGVPAEQLGLALWLESDRMGYLLPALDETKLANQKQVVRNERRQRYENVPYGNAWPTLLENLFPAGHPYHIATIGRHEEIDAAKLEDVKAFFTTWYVPSNASLVVCGDFDPKVAKRLIAGYFGDLPSPPKPAHPAPPAPVRLDRVVEVVAPDDAPFERLWVAWPTPAALQPGDAELDVLSESLAGGKDSRLYRALVEAQIAQEVSATQNSLRLQSIYEIEITLAPGHTATEAIAAVDAELAKIQSEGPTLAEVQTAQTRAEVGLHSSLSTLQGRADRLNSWWLSTGTPDGAAAELARYAAVTPDTVKTTAAQWLPLDRRLVLRIPPEAPVTEVKP